MPPETREPPIQRNWLRKEKRSFKFLKCFIDLTLGPCPPFAHLFQRETELDAKITQIYNKLDEAGQNMDMPSLNLAAVVDPLRGKIRNGYVQVSRRDRTYEPRYQPTFHQPPKLNPPHLTLGNSISTHPIPTHPAPSYSTRMVTEAEASARSERMTGHTT